MRPLFIIVGLIVTLGTAARSTAEGTQGASSTGVPKPVGTRVTPKEIKHELLPKAPGDLKVPLPPDAEYLAGYRTQYSTTKLITEIRFRTTNNMSTVADWYAKTLAGNGWQVTTNKTTGTTAVTGLTAMKSGVYCSLSFRAPDAKSTIVMMNYSEAR